MMKRKKKIKSRKKNKIKLLTWQNAIVGDATGSPPFTVWPSFSLRKVPTREDILALGFPHLRLFAHGGHTHREPHSFLRQFQNRKEKKSSEFKEREGKRKKKKNQNQRDAKSLQDANIGTFYYSTRKEASDSESDVRLIAKYSRLIGLNSVFFFFFFGEHLLIVSPLFFFFSVVTILYVNSTQTVWRQWSN